MVNKIKKSGLVLILVFAIVFFYLPFFLTSKLPIPSDSIVGLYHPYRDFYSNTYPNGIPFKNFLITDPVRQTYVWRELAVEIFKSGNIPLWNPYEMSGKPLLGNFQSSVFYPLNILFFVLPFSLGWSFLIFTQTLLFGLFTFYYLRNLKFHSFTCLLSAIAIAFSGFSISWLEWGNIISTALWLPLILLSIDKFTHKKVGNKVPIWYVTLLFALLCSFFAGHLQSFFYLYLVSFSYFCLRWFENKNRKVLLFFVILNLLFVTISFFQWFPTLEYILLSSRAVDQKFNSIEGWFIPWRHLIQFIVPDFFGNPTTLNYWGTWNYGELVGYIGVLPLLMVLFSFYKITRTTLFYLVVVVICLVMALPTGISSIPFVLNIPFLSTAQPTRLLFPIVFSLSVLSAIGMNKFLHIEKIKLKHFLPFIILASIFGLVLFLIFTQADFLFKSQTEILVAKRNIVFPFVVFVVSSFLLLLLIKIKNVKFRTLLLIIIVLVSFVDVLRFAQKFTPFSSSQYLYPKTSTLAYLSQQNGLFRVAVMDRRIMPPNFFTHYKIQTIEGYDPLYLKNYAEFITALERDKPNINPPFGFNRIITPHNYNSSLFDFLNTRFVISLDEIKTDKLVKVFEEGQTKIYENKKYFPRLFFVQHVIPDTGDISLLFGNDLLKTAIVKDLSIENSSLTVGSVDSISYTENVVTLKTNNRGNGYLVFSDVFYPTWRAYVDNVKTKIYITNHAFRGIFVPSGTHTVQFKNNLL